MKKEKIKKIIRLLNPDKYRIEEKNRKNAMFDYYIYLYFHPNRLKNVHFKKEIRKYHMFEMFLQDLFFKNEKVAFIIKEIK